MADAKNAELQPALDANAHEGIRLAAPVIAALLFFFAVTDLFVTDPPEWAIPVAVADLLASLAFLGAYLALRAGHLPARRAHVAGAALAGVIAINTLFDTYLLGDPEQTTYLMLVVVGAGAIFLHTGWLYAVIGVSMAGWIVVAAQHPEVSWTTFGFALFAASILGLLLHLVRVSTLERVERLRMAEAGRKAQLEIRESALESAVEALQESEDRYRSLLDGAPDAFVVHAGGFILYANASAAKLFAAEKPQRLIGKDVFSLVHPDFREAARERGRIVEVESRATEPMEMKCVRLDGRVVDIEAVGQPITYLGRAAAQSIIRDITDRKRADSERAVASSRLAEISRLKEMDRVKTQFVNTISHELRTPLTPIKVQLHILKASKDSAGMLKAAEVVERNVLRLSSLVDELLEVARIQAGNLKISKSYVPLGSTVSHALDSFVDVAKQDDIVLETSIEPDLHVLGDPRRIQQVIYNLMGNAFKFTPKGGRIEVVVRRDGDAATVSVRDSGMGMEPKDVERLFEAFTQVHDTMEQTQAGTGLGLYICRGIIEGHDGRIWAESEGKGQGATFLFSIPLAKDAV